MSRRQRGEVLRLILSLASRPDGVSRAELADRIVLASNAPILPAACKRGHIFSAKRPGQRLRYFLTEQNAAEWLAREPEPAPEKVKPPKPEKTATIKKPAAVKMGARTPHIPKPTEHQKPPTYTAGSSKTAPRSSGEVRGMDTAPRIVAKTPAGRFDPDPGYVGPFSLAGIGRDVQTGKAWAPSMGAGSVFAWRPAA